MVARKRKPKKNMKGRPRGGATVPCPHRTRKRDGGYTDPCGADSEVVITRRDGAGVRRRRQCLGDGRHLFDTREEPA
jgi:hypothetical protein